VGSVYLLGVQGGLVLGSVVGGAVAGAWGVVAPFWFAFAGSAVLVVALWPQLSHIAHAEHGGQDEGDEGGQPEVAAT
jgi:predicted MFS family arabinose efflux permease